MFEWYSNRARHLIFMARWSAGRRVGLYIEPDDLLHALIREDRGEFPALSMQIFPGLTSPVVIPTPGHQPFFKDDVARDLLRELHEEPEPLPAAKPPVKLEPAPHVDMPVSQSLKQVLAITARDRDRKTIEPLHLLAAILEDPDSRLANLLRDHGITREKVDEALDPSADSA